MSNFSSTSWLCFQNTSIHHFRLPTLKCTQKKKTHNFPFLSNGERRRNPSSTQVFFYMAIFSSSTVVVLALPLLYTFFLHISVLLQDHTPCTKTKLDINSWRMIVCLFFLFFFTDFQSYRSGFSYSYVLSYEAAAAPLEPKFLM